MVAGVGNVEKSLAIESQPGQPVEFSLTVALTPELHQQVALAVVGESTFTPVFR